MKQILYRSISKVDEIDVTNILEVSRKNNKANDITGFLIFHLDGFYQMIEGPDRNIEELVAKLGRDPRHTNIEILSSKDVEARHFPDWSMGYLKLGKAIGLSLADSISNEDAILEKFLELTPACYQVT
ncbi:putative Sensor of blue-light using FAD [Vibrio nigripulchritudo MADA3029]|uniref:BLUF domain-containing protein n=1 Tax=Vibrio nigripulchritudo TaxID=28173 RepID=UPI0003B23595|nr:BLUF domain-containing protein [Vibrio nigripulchritudo]CCN49714.1 putative Sensor of blue-light using FAD [Vibrio nigripulchritudo MADA3020]CCN54003.1 putative Sensor of blue-light using FAD [Vibrio nigripulchritudo MADA3021]CCN57426.1 putative Sensor of blue-light using FAD [Vibrio nigripulchritudo MADA3029]